jgi:deoxyadenosine/deoxycytidine kinase
MEKDSAWPRTQRVRPDARVFIVEGEIAAGKTELTRAIAAALEGRGLSVCLVLEPVDLWKSVGILQKFYGDPSRYGYSFQTYVFTTRVLAIAEAVAAQPDADVYLLERSPATDQIFWFLQEQVVDPVESKMYHSWCAAWKPLVPLDFDRSRVLYLQPSLDRCMGRLASRARPGEILRDSDVAADGSATGGVSFEYQRRLREAHEAFLLGKHPDVARQMPASPFRAENVITLRSELADLDFRESGADKTVVLERVLELLGY